MPLQIEELPALRAQLEYSVSLLESQIASADREAEQVVDALSALDEACTVLLAIASRQQEQVLVFLSETVSVGLSEVFGQAMVVEFRESIRSSQRVLDVVLKTAAGESDVPDGVGGGVTQVISVLTRLVLVYLLRGRKAQFVVLDESLAHLADVYVPLMADVMKQMAVRLGVQLILVTHQPDFLDVADVKVELSNDGEKAVLSWL